MLYLVLLVASVFLGTELLALPTPFLQITLYRVLTLGVYPILGIQLLRSSSPLKIDRNNRGTYFVGAIFLWWLTALVTLGWSESLSHWFQAFFLLTLGLGAVLSLYFFVTNLEQWKTLCLTIWSMMNGLVLWGVLEIMTNTYLFADLEKLDKYHTFTSNPWSRIPITIFENQNDYATMLLAYIATTVIVYALTHSIWLRLFEWSMALIAGYLIYRTDSRMSLLAAMVMGLLLVLRYFPIKRTLSFVRQTLAGVVGLIGAILVIKPSIIQKIGEVIYTKGQDYLTGDMARVNMMKNGFYFLGKTGGFGVGAGNIEHWMLEYGPYSTNGIANIHNWWLEILVGYGVLPFLVYLLTYLLLLLRLYQLSQSLLLTKKVRQMAYGLFMFMFVFIFASITSANNMLIEWHWVYFGMIASFVHLMDRQLKEITRGEKIEFKYNDL